MHEREQQLRRIVSDLAAAAGGTRRHDELITAAVADGGSREQAELVYDVALESGVDPAVALGVVLAGIGVRELAEAPSESWGETQVEALPPWVNAEAPDTQTAAFERRVRMTLRRLHSTLDANMSIDAGLQAFLSEPDVGTVDY